MIAIWNQERQALSVKLFFMENNLNNKTNSSVIYWWPEKTSRIKLLTMLFVLPMPKTINFLSWKSSLIIQTQLMPRYFIIDNKFNIRELETVVTKRNSFWQPNYFSSAWKTTQKSHLVWYALDNSKLPSTVLKRPILPKLGKNCVSLVLMRLNSVLPPRLGSILLFILTIWRKFPDIMNKTDLPNKWLNYCNKECKVKELI